MSTPSESELLSLAVPYALDAVDDAERAGIDRLLAAASATEADEFWARVAETRETMAQWSVETATGPPAALRSRVLAHAKGESHWGRAILAAVAVLAIGSVAFGAGWVLRPAPNPPVAEWVLTAPDVRAMSATLRTGGTATVVYSRSRGDGVVLLSDTPPSGMRYEVWLMKDGVPVNAGTVSDGARTVMVSDVGGASALGMTVQSAHSPTAEPPGVMVARVELP